MWNCKTLLLLAFAIIDNLGEMFSQKPPLGGIIKVHHNYKSLRDNISFISRNKDESWFFAEPSVNFFKNFSVEPHLVPRNEDDDDSTIALEMCDNLDELFHAFFRGLEVTEIAEPWRIFSDNWSQDEIADYFGIDQRSYLNDSLYCYLLVTIDRVRDSQEIANPLEDLIFNEALVRDVNHMDDAEFSNIFGSHYVHSYSTGNSVYQVLVFEKHFFGSFNSKPDTSKLQHAVDLAKDHENVLYRGIIKTSSGNRSVEAWANENSHTEINDDTYASLFDLAYYNESSSRYLYALLQDEVILQLELRSAAPLLEKLRKRSP